MERIIKTTQYLLDSLKVMMIICCGSILANAIINDIILYLNRKNGLERMIFSSNMEGTAITIIIVIGLVYSSIHFKVLLANGVSRRTYFWANLVSFSTLSVVFTIFVTVVFEIHSLFVPMIAFSQMIYPGSNLLEMVIFQFAMYFFSGVLGWLIFLAYYRSNTVMRWVISLAPLALISLFSALNKGANGAISAVLGNLFSAVMGFSSPVSNPILGTFTLLVIATGICALDYLLISRAPVKG